MKKLTLLLLALLYVTLTYAYTERDLLQKQADINPVSYTHLTLPTNSRV